MAVDERRRGQLFERLTQAVGEEAAATMFDLLPPAGTDLATRVDLDRLEARMGHGFDLVDQRFEQIDHRFEQIDQRLEQIDQRFEQIDHRLEQIDQRFHEMRSEITHAVAGQTRVMLLGMVTVLAGVAGLSLTFAQLF